MSVLAIDGPGGSGKSTVAAALAGRLGWVRLDTGAMYRALALEALRKGVEPDDEPALGELAAGLALEVGERVLLDGEDVTEAIRSPEVDAVVSRVAAHPAVRAELVGRQQAWIAAHPTAVVEGRDIGSVVAPDAALKVYLDAHPEVRAARRAEQGAARGADAEQGAVRGAAGVARAAVEGTEGATRGPSGVAAALAARDALDTTRADSPLLVSEGALVIDSSELGVDEVVARVLEALAERGITPVAPTPAGALAARASAATGPITVSTTRASVPTAPATASTAWASGPKPAAEQPAGPAADQQAEMPAVHAPTPGELAFYAACRLVAVGLSRLGFPGPVLGGEHVPAEGAFVLAPSHRSYVDWLIAARVTKRRLRFLVKGEVWRSKSAGRLVEALGGFPVHRGTTDRLAFNRALGVLQVGEPLVLFPEGTRKSGPEIAELQEGAAYLALRAGVPIVPVGLGGTEQIMPRGSRLVHLGQVCVVVGEPIHPGEVLGPAAPGRSGRVPRSATRQLTELLRARLQELFDEAERQVGSGPRPPSPARSDRGLGLGRGRRHGPEGS